MKKIQLAMIMAMLLTSYVMAFKAQSVQIRPGARVFIAPMEGNLNTFLAAEIIKQKVPIVVVLQDAEADYILTGVSVKTGDAKWYDVMFGTPKDKNEGSVQLVSVKTKSLVWAGEAGDRSLWWSGLKRGGQRKVADRIISQLKKDLFKDSKGDGWHPADATSNEQRAAQTTSPPVTAKPTPTPAGQQTTTKKPCFFGGKEVPCSQ